MNEERVEELLFSISGKLSSIEAKLTSTQETLLRHESRITCIEDKIGKCSLHQKESKGDFKDQLLMILSKSLIVALVTLATITGAGSIIPKIVSM